MIKHRFCRETPAEILYGMRCRDTKAVILRIFIAQPQHAAPESIGPVVIVIELVSSIHADMRESPPNRSIFLRTFSIASSIALLHISSLLPSGSSFLMFHDKESEQVLIGAIFALMCIILTFVRSNKTYNYLWKNTLESESDLQLSFFRNGVSY